MNDKMRGAQRVWNHDKLLICCDHGQDTKLDHKYDPWTRKAFPTYFFIKFNQVVSKLLKVYIKTGLQIMTSPLMIRLLIQPKTICKFVWIMSACSHIEKKKFLNKVSSLLYYDQDKVTRLLRFIWCTFDFSNFLSACKWKYIIFLVLRLFFIQFTELSFHCEAKEWNFSFKLHFSLVNIYIRPCQNQFIESTVI